MENMSGEMKLTPTFSFLPPAPRSPPLAPRSYLQPLPWQGGRKYTVNCGHGVTSASVSLYFHPLVFTVIHCSLALCLEYSVCTSCVFAAHIEARTGARTHILRHFSLSSTPSLLLLSPSLPLLLSSSGRNLGCIGMSPFIAPPFVRRIEESVQTWESVC